MSRMRRRPLRTEQAEEEPDIGDWGEDGGLSEEKPGRQRRETEPYNPKAWLALIFHMAMAVFYSILIYHTHKIMYENRLIYDPDGKIPEYGGRFKYLSDICLWVQLAFFDLQFVTEYLPKSNLKRKLQKVSDVLFTTVALPLSLFVTLTFWALYAVDPELIYPKVFDMFVPPYLNHFWHTTIALSVLLEILLVFHHFPSAAVAATLVFVYSAGYISWVVWVYTKTGWWPYPVLRVFPTYLKALFFGAGIFVSLGLHLIGKTVSYIRWGSLTVH